MEAKSLNISSLQLGVSESQKIFSFLLPEFKVKKTSANEDFDVVSHIRNGLPKKAVYTLLKKTAVTRVQLSDILHISTRQLNRYKDLEKLSSEQSNFLYEFTRLYIRTLEILGDMTTADSWLNRPNTGLGGASPIQMLDTAEGFRMVDDLLAQIEFGFFA